MFFGGYGLYILFSLPALLLGFWAQARVRSAFNRYSRVRTAAGLSGAEVARRMLAVNGLYDVSIEVARGFMGDHYDPRTKTLRLSSDVYRSNSVAAAGIAAPSPHAAARMAFKVKCPACGDGLVFAEGCNKCLSCGWAQC